MIYINGIGHRQKKNIAAGTGDDPTPAAIFIAFYQ